jgi:hypothetical protein
MTAIACVLVTALLIPFSLIESVPGPIQPRNPAVTITAEEIVAKYLEAIGGAEALKAIDSKKLRYRVHMFSRAGYLMERSWKRPNTMQTGEVGQSTYMLTEGDKSWRVGPEERRELPPHLAANLAKLADIDGPLVDSTKKGISLSYLGAVRHDMTELHRVELTFKDGVQWELFFDSRTGYLRKVKQPTFLMLNNEVSRGPDAMHYYYDYRSVDGVMIPHLWVQITEDHVHAFTVEAIELNK